MQIFEFDKINNKMQKINIIFSKQQKQNINALPLSEIGKFCITIIPKIVKTYIKLEIISNRFRNSD